MAIVKIKTVGLMLAGLALTLTACDSGGITDRADNTDLASFAASHVESVTAEPIAGKSGKEEYLLRIVVRKDLKHVRLPDAINILGHRRGQGNTLIRDDGEGSDRFAGDGIFTGIIPEGCIQSRSNPTLRVGKKSLISCKFEVVAPGSDCGTYGECPETAHRSFLWGLIEYDTEVTFCFCLTECELSK